jgi:phosphoribosylamine--glycine ligase
LEASKAFSKAFMVAEGIPTAAARTFERYAEARAYVESLPEGPLVVKASGLTAGKGAIVCNDQAEALNALDLVMVRRDFGSAGDTVVVEERLNGWETSAQAFCDGKTAVLMPFATDYKRAQDGDRGLNTGGMGAYSPSAGVDESFADEVTRRVVQPVMAGMAARGTPFNGTLFPGLMVTGDGIRVLEFNARFGDPETQVVMPRLESDLFAICRAAAEGRLAEADVRWSPRPAVGVVLASGGYPATYKIGYVIEGLDTLDEDVLVFHAGTKNDARGIVTSGGRVLTVVATGETLAEARRRAYENVARIRFVDMQYRRDIGVV